MGAQMPRGMMLSLYFLAVFLQSGAYGLTFMLPRLFDSFGATEKDVGAMLFITAVSTLITVYFAGHLSDIFGRLLTLCLACCAIAASLFLFGIAASVGVGLVVASLLLGAGWGLTYSLGPIVLTRVVSARERSRYFALLSVFVMAGFGVSPAFSALLEAQGYSVRDAFLITATLCLISATLFLAIRGPVKALAINPGPEVSSRITLGALREVLNSRARVPVVMVFLGASVFAGMSNFQTVFAEARGLDYATFFLTYTVTVIVLRLVLASSTGGKNPYRTIAVLQYIMCASVVLFIFSASNPWLYVVVAILFGIGYGVSYPILVAMTANDAEAHLGPQTLQLFALFYFVGVFGFPLIAGWMIVEVGTVALLAVVAILAAAEASMALRRSA